MSDATADAITVESLAEASVPQIYVDLYQTTSHELAIFLRGDLDAGAIPALRIFSRMWMRSSRNAALSRPEPVIESP